MTQMRFTGKRRPGRSIHLPDGIRHGNVELRHLRYFVVVAEELNLRRAADRLEITQPAVTKQVAGLEEQVGVSLFARDRGRLTGLTSAGAELLAEARHIVEQVEEAVRRVQLVALGRAGRLRIGLTDDAATLALTSILAAFHARSPKSWSSWSNSLSRRCSRLCAQTRSISHLCRSRRTRVVSPLKIYGRRVGASSFPRDTRSVVRRRLFQLTSLANLSPWSVLRLRRRCCPGCAALARNRIGPALHSVF